MDEKATVFNEYIAEFKKLDIKKKRLEFINALRELIVVFEEIAKVDNIHLSFLKNKEILDLNAKEVSEDDFLEAALVYLEVAKDLIGQYLDQKI